MTLRRNAATSSDARPSSSASTIAPLHRGVKAGQLVRIRQGAYCHCRHLARPLRGGQHLARAHASHDLLDGEVALSHISALAEYGCPLWEAPLDRVHVTRSTTAVAHRGRCRSPPRDACHEDVHRAERALLTAPTRSTARCAHPAQTRPRESWPATGCSTKDSPARPSSGRPRSSMRRWPRTLSTEVVVRLLDGDSQSVGESLRASPPLEDAPALALSCSIASTTAAAGSSAITDFAWPEHGVYGEFDGRVKYGRLLKPGQDPGEVVFAEKRREDLDPRRHRRDHGAPHLGRSSSRARSRRASSSSCSAAAWPPDWAKETRTCHGELSGPSAQFTG